LRETKNWGVGVGVDNYWWGVEFNEKTLETKKDQKTEEVKRMVE